MSLASRRNRYVCDAIYDRDLTSPRTNVIENMGGMIEKTEQLASALVRTHTHTSCALMRDEVNKQTSGFVTENAIAPV